jgi:hypothetical protein
MEADITSIRNGVEDYTQTVQAILGFAAFVVHDGAAQRRGAAFGLGRRMTTSEQNAIAAVATVTPDLVAQVSATYGVVAEAKKSLPADESHWHRYVEQLRKYDDALLGWWTSDESIPRADVVLLIHHSRSRAFKRLLEQARASDPASVGLNTCIVEFIHSAETASYYSFRLEYGQMTEALVGDRLTDGVSVPMDRVLASYPNIKYYDSEPPLELLLTSLWSDVLPSLAGSSEYDEDLHVHKVHVTAAAITDELQRAYGSGALARDPRSAEFPRQVWVRRALERLVEYGLASAPPKGSDVFEVHFRHFRKDILQRFAELALKRKSSGKQPSGYEETPLFPVTT